MSAPPGTTYLHVSLASHVVVVQNVDYIGLDAARERLLFYASSPDALRDLRVPMASLRTYGSMTIASHLTDAHLYILNR